MELFHTKCKTPVLVDLNKIFNFFALPVLSEEFLGIQTILVEAKTEEVSFYCVTCDEHIKNEIKYFLGNCLYCRKTIPLTECKLCGNAVICNDCIDKQGYKYQRDTTRIFTLNAE